MTLAIAALPILVLAAEFTDVPPSSPYYADVTAISNAGVTAGCGGGNYCPGSAVTREQMSVFISLTFALTLYGV